MLVKDVEQLRLVRNTSIAASAANDCEHGHHGSMPRVLPVALLWRAIVGRVVRRTLERVAGVPPRIEHPLLDLSSACWQIA